MIFKKTDDLKKVVNNIDNFDFILTHPSIQTSSGTSGAPIVLWTYKKGNKVWNQPNLGHPVGCIIGVHNGVVGGEEK